MGIEPSEAVPSALARDDLDVLDRLLEEPRARAELNVGWFGLSHPPMVAAKSTQAIQLLIKFGADINRVSEWWGPGFGLRKYARLIWLVAFIARASNSIYHFSTWVRDERCG